MSEPKASDPPIAFPAVARPEVSVVMVTYGGWPWVAGALAALAANSDPCYEVVVVDNASPDGMAEALAEGVTGATLVPNDRNVGFGAGANLGALHARGRHLFFLNSDAFVQPGWLPPLLAALESDRGAAAAAPCLLEPDGRLQEAAGLVGRGGHAGQLGLGEDAGSFEHRFRRRVDFASAAALLVRRRDFADAGGFDPAYGMGYFEDVDLCLGLWDGGRAVLYEPRSRVVHLRGASTTHEESQTRAAASHPVFVSRWGELLAGRPWLVDLESHPHRRVAARDARAPDRILVVDRRVPAVGGSAEDRRAASVLGAMATLWPEVRVTLLAADSDGADDAAPPLLERGVEVAAGEDWERWFAARRFHYSGAVVRSGAALGRFDGLLCRYQPQARRVPASLLDLAGDDVDGGGRAALVAAMAELGVAPPEG